MRININTLKNLLPIKDKDLSVNIMETIESFFFAMGKNYRENAIEFCTENDIDFSTTTNTNYDFAKAHVKVSCPKCGNDTKNVCGGGNAEVFTSTYKCPKCETKTSITTPVGGYSVTFKE